MKLIRLARSKGSACVVCIVMATVLAAPALTVSLQINVADMIRYRNFMETQMEIDYEPKNSPDSFDASNYDIADYRREDIALSNRGLVSDELLFGSVDEGSVEAAIPAPADMTIYDDNTKVYLNTDGVNMHEYPALEAAVLRQVSVKEEFVRTGMNPIWVRVTDKDGISGYISVEYITDKKPTPIPTLTPIPTPTKKPVAKTTVKSSSPAVANTLGESVAQEVLKYMGIRYRGAVADPARGFDCSGLTWYVFNRYGINTPRGTDYYYNAGIVIPYSQIAPGDVIAWDTRKNDGRITITHVGIYIGNGMMVHASSTKNAVVKESVSKYVSYGCKIVSVHRFIKS